MIPIKSDREIEKMRQGQIARGLRPFDEDDIAQLRVMLELAGTEATVDDYARLFAFKPGRITGDITPTYTALDDDAIHAWSDCCARRVSGGRPSLEGGFVGRGDKPGSNTHRQAAAGPEAGAGPSDEGVALALFVDGQYGEPRAAVWVLHRMNLALLPGCPTIGIF